MSPSRKLDSQLALAFGLKVPTKSMLDENVSKSMVSQFFEDKHDQDKAAAVNFYVVTSTLYSQFMYLFSDIRNIVLKYDRKYGKTNNPDKKWYNIFTPSKVELVDFISTDLVYTQPPTGEGEFIDDNLNIFLRHPITSENLHTFLSLNRKYLKKDERGNIVMTYKKEVDEEDGLDRIVYLSELTKESNIRLIEFDDQFTNSELVYAIIVNEGNKRINVVFRGSLTGQDWKQDFKYNYLDLCDLKGEGKAKFKTEYITPEDMKLCSASETVKFHHGFVEYLFGETPDPHHDSKFDKIADTLQQVVEKYKGYEIVITGHSLGGALTQLLAFALASSKHCRSFLPVPIRAVSYASPPVGNRGYQEQFRHLEEKGILQHIRFTNQGDVVPVAPFPRRGYTQTGLNMHVFENQQMHVEGFKNTKSFLSQVSFSPIKCHSLDRSYWERIALESNQEYLKMSIEELYESNGRQA